MNRFSKNTVFFRPVVAEQCDMQFLKIDTETNISFYTSLDVVVHFFFTEYIIFTTMKNVQTSAQNKELGCPSAPIFIL